MSDAMKTADFLDFINIQGIFCPSLGAEVRPYSHSKIAFFFPNAMSEFCN